MIKPTPYSTVISKSIKFIAKLAHNLNKSEYNGHIHLFFRAVMNVMNYKIIK